MERKVKSLLKAHQSVFLGPDLPYVEHNLVWVWWRLGFIHGAEVNGVNYSEERRSELDGEQVLKLLLAHPSARFLQELVLGSPDTVLREFGDYSAFIRCIAEAPPRVLRTLFLGGPEDIEVCDRCHHFVGDVAPLYPGVPQLRSLRLAGANIHLGNIDLPELREFRLESAGLPLEAVKSITRARWPKLERLEVWFGSKDCSAAGGVEDVRPLLDAQGLSELRHLGLCNAEFTNALCAALPESKVLKQLHTLDLSRGTMTDEGAELLLAHAAAFAHLQRLDVSQNLLGTGTAARLSTLCPEVVLGNQRLADSGRGSRLPVAVSR
jgi:hypothetical protein